MTDPQRAEVDAREVASRLARGEDVTAHEFQALRSRLAGYLRHGFPTFTTTTIDELTDDSIERFIRAHQAGRVEPDTALAYLRRITKNRAIDHLRTRRGESQLHSEEPIPDDDAIAKFVDEQATAQAVEKLLADAAAAGQPVVTSVINSYLDVAESLGISPSSRQVARACGYSHTTVQAVLAQLKEQLKNAQFPDR